MSLLPAVQTTAGARLYMAAELPAAETPVGYQGITEPWTEISEITDFGNIVEAFTPVEHTVVATRRTQTMKGTKEPVEVTITLGRVRGDAGQNMFKDAFESDNNYSFKLVLKDGSTFYNYGLVMNNPLSLGGANSVTGGAVTVRFNGTKMVYVADGAFTLAYTADEHGKIIGNANQIVESGGNGQTVIAVPLNALTHEFDKWSDDVETSERTDTNVTENITVQAIFKTVEG